MAALPMLVAALLLVTGFVATATAQSAPSPVGATPPAPTLQQLFNDATEAGKSGNCAKALPLFEALSRDPRIKPGSLPAAAIAVRRGQCLVKTGDLDDGAVDIEAGLTVMAAAGADFAGDVDEAWRLLGDAALLRGDHDGAIRAFSALLERKADNGVERAAVLLRLASASAFDGGPQPLALADEALRIAAALPKFQRQLRVNALDIHARILLNQGQAKAAYAELKQALDLSGGLTDTLNVFDASLRGDLAQAAALAGDRTQARTYLAYTGAGQSQTSPFDMAESIGLPPCGEESGLTPADTAIVEFGIAADGTVPAAQTAYSRGNFKAAAAFADAVRHWRWRPEVVAKLPLFYRILARVELRCTTGTTGGMSLAGSLSDPVHAAARVQAPELFVVASNEAWHVKSLPDIRRVAETAEQQGRTARAALAWAVWAMHNSGAGHARVAGFDKALALGGRSVPSAAAPAGTPAEAPALPRAIINALTALRWRAVIDELHRRAQPDSTVPLALWADALSAARTAPLSEDALAADTILLSPLSAKLKRTDDAAAEALARQVADDQRLGPGHRLRQYAWLWLANHAAAAGRLDEAQGWFARTGLTEQQCALLGPQPALRRGQASSSDYPTDAWQMGIGGWVRMEFNINADGTTSAPRAVIAYPPLIFVDAATGMTRSLRYQSSYRPAGSAACTGNGETYRFITG